MFSLKFITALYSFSSEILTILSLRRLYSSVIKKAPIIEEIMYRFILGKLLHDYSYKTLFTAIFFSLCYCIISSFASIWRKWKHSKDVIYLSFYVCVRSLRLLHLLFLKLIFSCRRPPFLLQFSRSPYLPIPKSIEGRFKKEKCFGNQSFRQFTSVGLYFSLYHCLL